MKTLTSRINDRYLVRGIQPTNELTVYAEACDSYAAGKISSDEIQAQMCTYLDASASRFRSLSEALGRDKEPSIAEIVTESVNMFVDSVIRTPELSALKLEVFSERNVKLPVGGYRKPDVAIWSKETENPTLKVVIECKTCLGRRRKEWMGDFEDRVKEFSSIGVNPSSMLLFVGTDTTWKGFPQDDPRVHETWFSLCPTGTWYGGGKAGEVSLSQKQHPNVLKKLHEVIITLTTK